MSYSPGLENVVASATSISTLDLENHVIVVRGYNLVELAQKSSYEEVVHLLLYGHLPDRGELDRLSEELKSERKVRGEIYSILSSLPKGTPPMTALQVGVAALAGFDPDLEDNSHDANLRKAKRLVAKTATLVANSYRILTGEDTIQPDNTLGHSANLFYMITGRRPTEEEQRMFDTLFTMYAEHELAVSTFTSRVVASSLTDMYGAIVSALAALKGPLHGRANEEAVKMLLEIGEPARVEAYLSDLLSRGLKVMGLGHRVYKKGIDPRAVVGRELLGAICKKKGREELFEMTERVTSYMEAKKNLYPNVDFYAGPAFYMLDIPIPLYTPIFAASRMAGWTAHIIEQQDRNKLFRPRALYEGAFNKPYVPIGER